MKKNLCVLFLFCLSLSALSQGNTFFKTYFTEDYDSNHFLYKTHLSKSQDIFLLMSGEVVAKVSMQGQLEWEKKVELADHDLYLYTITEVEEQGIMLNGIAYNQTNSSRSIVSILLDYDGVVKWIKKEAKTGDPKKIVQQGSSYYLLSKDSSQPGHEIILDKISGAGEFLIRTTLPGSIIDITQAGAGVVVASQDNGTRKLTFLDENLIQIKQIDIPVDPTFVLNAMTAMPSGGGFVFTGTANDDLLLLKLSADGTKEWIKQTDIQQYDEGLNVSVSSDGILIAGNTGMNIDFMQRNNDSDVFLLKTNFAGEVSWIKAFGGRFDDYSVSVQETPAGEILLTGRKYLELSYPFVALCDASGNIGNFISQTQSDLFITPFKDDIQDQNGESIIAYSQNGEERLLISGTYSTSNGPKKLGWMITDAQGNITRPLTTLNQDSTDYLEVIKRTSTGSFIGIASSKNSFITQRHYVFKLSKEGDLVWLKKIKSNGSYLKDIHIMDDGSFYAFGSLDVNFVDYDPWVIKFDTDGNMQWRKTISTSKWDLIKTVLPTTNGFLLAGEKINTYDGGQNTVLTKVDFDGNLIWQQNYTVAFNEVVKGLAKTHDNHYLIGGATLNSTMTQGDAFLIKVDQNGNQIWAKTYDKLTFDRFNDLVVTEGGLIYACGSVYLDGPLSNSAALLYKLSPDGDILEQKYIGKYGASSTLFKMAHANSGELHAIGTTAEIYGQGKIMKYTIQAEPVLSNKQEFLLNSFTIATNQKEIYLTGDNNYTGPMSLVLYDIQGKKITSLSLEKTSKVYKQALAIPQIQKGIYIVQLIYGGEKLSKKIVKL